MRGVAVFQFSLLVSSTSNSSNYVHLLFGANLADPVHPVDDVEVLGVLVAKSNDPPRAPHNIRLFRNNGAAFDAAMMDAANVPQAGVFSKITGILTATTLDLTIDFLNDGSRVENHSFTFPAPVGTGQYFAFGNYDGIGVNRVEYAFDDIEVVEF